MSIRKDKNNENDENIVILRKTEPCVCGGTDATFDKSAPKEILSEDMISFDVTSALSDGYIPSDTRENEFERLAFISAYAVPAGDGTFLLLEKGTGFRRYGVFTCAWAAVKENILPALTALVKECALAKSNGYHSETHGLPENFGGSVYIRYADGEKISFSNNQTPIITFETAAKIAALFTKAMSGERIPLPDVSALRAIRFAEERENGGFTRATLTLRSDGTGVNQKTSKYDGPTVYESEKEVDAETVAAIKKNIADCGLFAWQYLPESSYKFSPVKTLTFVFEDGGELTIDSERATPEQIGRGFFNIELEMTTKH